MGVLLVYVCVCVYVSVGEHAGLVAKAEVCPCGMIRDVVNSIGVSVHVCVCQWVHVMAYTCVHQAAVPGRLQQHW